VKILFLDQFSELGGAQQTLLDTVAAVQRNGWEARALLPGRGPLIEKLRSLGVPTGEISSGPYGSGGKSVADSMRFAWDLRGQVRIIGDLTAQEDFDLIYVNGPRLMPAAAFASRGRAQVVFHAHSHVDGIAARFLHWGIRRAAAIVIACSNSVLDPMRHCADPRKMFVVPNGVRDTGYRERNFRFDGGSGGNWRIGIIGRIAPDKGQLEFADAAAILAREFPGARFVICGAALFGSSTGYLDALRQRSHGLPVEFLEWQQDVGSVLRELDLLAVPSKREGMARVIVEAFSAGVPVVAFPAGGIPEVVLDGETGFLTRQFSADALASRIRDVIESPEALQRVARNSRKAWARSYTVTAYQERITNLLAGLLERVPPAASADCDTEALRLGT
jgi:glycosyltransferase involved in cell wall biosynthesis